MTVADVWLFVPVLCLTMYIVLDGYDLGIGILLLAERDRTRRRDGIEVVAQTWDINESWLILLGVSLWAGFPAVFGAALPHLYVPVILMLFCLIVRGFSTELISQRPESGEGWVRAFCWASLGAAISQGLALAGLTMAIPLSADGDFLGPVTPWSPSAIGFALVVTVCVLVVYTALGAAYLRGKVDSPPATAYGRPLVLIAALLLAGTVGLLSVTEAPLTFSGVQGVLTVGLLLIAALGAVMAWRALAPGARGGYRWVVLMVVAALAAIVAGRYPVLLAPDVSVERAGAPTLTMIALFIGVGINVVLILVYTTVAHRVFTGPLHPESEPRREAPRS